MRAQEPAKQHRIAIVLPAGPVTRINDPASLAFRAFWEELRRLGDVEGQNLIVERYSGEGRPERYADLARKVVSRNPEVIVAIAGLITSAISAATGTIPIVASGPYTSSGVLPSLARPGGNMTGIRVEEPEIRSMESACRSLKEAVPAASKAAYLTTRVSLAAEGQQLREAGGRLQISVIELALEEVTSTAVQRAFAEIAQQQSDAVIVNSNSLLFPHRQLIVELAEKSRLPALYPWREYVEAGGLMAYASDNRELWLRMADDVHQILNGTKPGDIPIYQPTKFDLVINLKAARAIDLTIPPSLLAAADEVIE